MNSSEITAPPLGLRKEVLDECFNFIERRLDDLKVEILAEARPATPAQTKSREFLTWEKFQKLSDDDRARCAREATGAELLLLAVEWSTAKSFEAIATLSKRIKELEAELEELCPISYRGVFLAGKSYRRGEAVTHGGSLWIAEDKTDGPPGATASGWRLAVKRGDLR